MRPSFLLLFFALLFVPKNAASQNLNEYKYVIVPMKYGFLQENDKYQLNSLTKFLFEKYGFTAVLEGEDFPEDLKGNRCSALTADVISDSGMLSFNRVVVIILKNCNGQIVFKSKEGRSRLKKYKFSYQEALRNAFSSVKALHHSYAGTKQNKIEIQHKKNNSLARVENPEKKEEEKVSEVEQSSDTNFGTFELGGKEYVIENEGKALALKEQGTGEPIALLNATSKGNFIFRSKKINGTAYFTEQGNLIVEYFDTGANAMKKRIYVKQ